MFIGHFGVGFGLKRIAPQASLGVLMATTVWADILWTVFLLLGWEHVRISVADTRWTPLDFYDYPWSHSLLMLVVWAAVLALLYRALHEGDASEGQHWAMGIPGIRCRVAGPVHRGSIQRAARKRQRNCVDRIHCDVRLGGMGLVV